MDDRLFRKEFYRSLHDEPLEPDDPRYVPLYDEQEDVVLQLLETIEFSSESTQLLSGYRGSGKSTELRRLRAMLREAGFLVVLVDIEEYLDLNSPVDISDFLLALAGAVGEALEASELLGASPAKESVWARFAVWLGSEVHLTEVQAKAKGPGGELALKAELKGNPTFRKRLQENLAASVGRFALEVRAFMGDCVKALRRQHSEAARVVVLVDSIEHARGTSTTEADVYAGLERLFAQHDDKVRFPGMHLVYTVPPWLRIQRPNIGSLYDGEGLLLLPTQKVRERGAGDPPGAVFQPGVDRLVKLVSERGDWARLLGSRAVLERLVLETGGHLRDLIRLLATVTLRARTALPASEAAVENAVSRLREQLLPIPLEDARWLAAVAHTRGDQLRSFDQLGTLARYFDGHLVLAYRNGSPWYDVHPLVREHVLTMARAGDAV